MNLIPAAAALPLALLTPLLGALAISQVGHWPRVREGATLATAIVLFLVVLRVAAGQASGEALEFEVVQLLPGLSLSLHAEPLSILFAVLASGLWIVTSVYSHGYLRGAASHDATRFHVCFALALCGAMGVAFASNLLTLFVFYEVLTLSTYPLVSYHGNERARAGARTYLLFLLSTSIGLLLPAIVWTWYAAGTLDFRPGGILAGHLEGWPATVLLLMFVLGTAKAAVMPMHRWLPAAMVAPTPVSALLHAVAVVKAGVFTLTKVVLYTFGPEFLEQIPGQRLALYLAGFTVVAASLVALRQTNLKRLLAYSTIGQLGYVVMATLALAPYAQLGAALHIVAHAFGKITLFFAAGAIYIASKKTETTQLRGIGRRMPWTMAAFAIGAMSMIGIPPTAGFVSKWFIVAGAFQADSGFVLAVLALSTGLSAAYFLPIVHRAFFVAEDQPPAKDHGEAPGPMVIALTTTALLTLALFFWHAPVLELGYGLIGGPP